MREPIVAGQFYESDPYLLIEQIKKAFSEEISEIIDARAIIVPHAGFMFSGRCAASAFGSIRQILPKRIFLLGPSHRGFPTCFSKEDWKTPLGIVETDKQAIDRLSKTTGIPINDIYHHSEHSIEMQLPFFQFIYDEVPMIVPLMVSDDTDLQMIGEILSKEKGMIVVSSDFTHYGNSFDYLPFTDNIKENMYGLDRSAIDLILSKDIQGFQKLMLEKQPTICGSYPILLLLNILKDEKGRLLKYYTSGDITGDYSNAVGYASIVFY